MSAPIYEEVLNQIRLLELIDQVRLLEELATIVRYRVTAWPKHSILELEGLGKEIWQGIDVQKYIEEERNSWE
jgi:hypothetical protein